MARPYLSVIKGITSAEPSFQQCRGPLGYRCKAYPKWTCSQSQMNSCATLKCSLEMHLECSSNYLKPPCMQKTSTTGWALGQKLFPWPPIFLLAERGGFWGWGEICENLEKLGVGSVQAGLRCMNMLELRIRSSASRFWFWYLLRPSGLLTLLTSKENLLHPANTSLLPFMFPPT